MLKNLYITITSTQDNVDAIMDHIKMSPAKPVVIAKTEPGLLSYKHKYYPPAINSACSHMPLISRENPADGHVSGESRIRACCVTS